MPRPFSLSSRSLIVLGASSRALAESALRAGSTPIAVDLFADVDLRARCRAFRIPRVEWPCGIPRALARLPRVPVVWTGALENHPEVLARIAASRPVLGTSPRKLAAVRDPRRLGSVLASAGLRAPRCALAGERVDAAGTWLVKPLRSAAGIGVRIATEDEIPANHYGQALIPGTPASIVGLGWRGGARLLGATRQLIGVEWLGASGFRYAGNVGPIALSPRLEERLERAARAVARAFELRGLFGIDLVIDDDGEPWGVEVNPRYTASVEVIERATGRSLLDLHLRATLGETISLSSLDGLEATRRAVPRIVAKGILWARSSRRVPADLAEPFATSVALADVPAPGDEIPAGHPVTTILVEAATEDEAVAILRRAASEIDERLLDDAVDAAPAMEGRVDPALGPRGSSLPCASDAPGHHGLARFA